MVGPTDELQGFVAQIPWSFTAATPKPRYPKRLGHLGDHLRARRIDLGLLQKDAAAQIGVDTATVTSWELGHAEPEERFIPALIAFLGYNPLPEARSPGEQVRRARLTRGLSIRALAELAIVDEGSVTHLESGNPRVNTGVAIKVWAALGM
jgi:transcriptional regulator with XRE-family HTH domain